MNWTIFKKIVFCLSIGLIGLFPAYRAVGIPAPPNWSLFIYFAVYTFILVEAIAVNRGERSRVMLALTLLCGLTYYIGLLFQPTPEGISHTSVISAGFAVSSAALALYKGGKVEVLAIGSRRRLLLSHLWVSRLKCLKFMRAKARRLNPNAQKKALIFTNIRPILSKDRHYCIVFGNL